MLHIIANGVCRRLCVLCASTTRERSDELVLLDLHRVHVGDVLLEPALLVGNLHIVSGHLTLLHQTVLPERPVLCKQEQKKRRVSFITGEARRNKKGERGGYGPRGRTCGTTAWCRLAGLCTTRTRTAGGDE